MKLPPRTWAWAIVVAISLAVLLQLTAIWTLLPKGAPADQGKVDTGAPPPGDAAALAAAARAMAGPLESAVVCIGQAGLHLGQNAATGQAGDADASPSPRFLRALDDCQARSAGMAAALVFDAGGVLRHAMPASAKGAAESLSPSLRAQLASAQTSGVTMYLPARPTSSGPADHIDQLVPLNAKPPVTVLLRHSLTGLLGSGAGGRSIPPGALAVDDFSGGGAGEAIPGVRGIRLVWAGTGARAEGTATGGAGQAAGLRWMLAGLTLSLLMLVLASVYWLTRAHQRSQASLQREAALREDIVQSIEEGLRIVDHQGRITWVNQSFCKLSGWDESRLLGQAPPYPFWPKNAKDDRTQFLDAVLEGQQADQAYRVEFERPDLTRWKAQVRARRLAGGEGWILACTDITRETDTKNRLDSMLRDVERRMADMQLLDRVLDFLHTMTGRATACESACDGLARNLAEGRTELLAKGAELVSKAAFEMHHDIEEFRPLLQGNELPEKLSLWDVAEFALAREAAKTEAQNIKVFNNIARELPPLVLKKWSLTTVLGNLVSNSVASMEGVALANRSLTLDSYLDLDARRVYVHVRDRGRGIPADRFEAIFERGNTDREEGNGVGLFRSRHLVKTWGGTLKVERSEQHGANMGTTMQLVLPLPKDSDTLNEVAQK